MQTITIEIKEGSVLKTLQELEKKQLIRIHYNADGQLLSLPGNPVSEKEFKDWISYAENSSVFSLPNSKKRWEMQKEKLRKHTG